ncbi:hypothetical protein ACWDZ4_27930 [Streptomyces sp. NPDC003016]
MDDVPLRLGAKQDQETVLAVAITRAGSGEALTLSVERCCTGCVP